jgi:hypothetical protein
MIVKEEPPRDALLWVVVTVANADFPWLADPLQLAEALEHSDAMDGQADARLEALNAQRALTSS